MIPASAARLEAWAIFQAFGDERRLYEKRREVPRCWLEDTFKCKKASSESHFQQRLEGSQSEWKSSGSRHLQAELKVCVTRKSMIFVRLTPRDTDYHEIATDLVVTTATCLLLCFRRPNDDIPKRPPITGTKTINGA